MDIEDRQTSGPGPGQRLPVQKPLKAQRRRAACADGKRRGVTDMDRLAVWRVNDQRRQRTLTDAGRAVKRLHFGGRQSPVVVAHFIHQSVEELADRTAAGSDWIIKAANEVGAVRIHGQCAGCALGIEDAVNVKAQDRAVPGPHQVAELADGDFVGAGDVEDSGQADVELEGD